MLRSAAHTRAQWATFSSSVMVTFFMTQIYCDTKFVSTKTSRWPQSKVWTISAGHDRWDHH